MLKIVILSLFFVNNFIIGEMTALGPGNCTKLKVTNGRVRYRQKGKFVKFTCNPGFIIAGDKYSTCIHGEWDSPVPRCVKPVCYKVKPPNNGLIYPTHGGAVLNFYCRANYKLKGPQMAYCDGRKWSTNLPSCIPSNSTAPLSCDFENEDLCGWSHDLNHDFDWRRLNFNTPSGSIGTGPSYDHTKGLGEDGYYMYIESSSRNENDTAKLVSPVYDKMKDDTCFEFYYHMFGVTTGSLRVYLKKESEDWDLKSSRVIFSKHGNQGDQWFRSYHNLGVIDEDFQIVIEGIRGPGYVSDIAIDDVKIILHCDYHESEQESEGTTEVTAETEQFLQIESCENRCGSNKSATSNENFQIICDCDEFCYDNNRCCPDFIDFCVLANTASYTEPYSTTDIPNEIPNETVTTIESSTNVVHRKPPPVTAEERTTSTTSTAKPITETIPTKKTTQEKPSTTTLVPTTPKLNVYTSTSRVTIKSTTTTEKVEITNKHPKIDNNESNDFEQMYFPQSEENDESNEVIEEKKENNDFNLDYGKETEDIIEHPYHSFKVSKHTFDENFPEHSKWLLAGVFGVCALCVIIIVASVIIIKKYTLYNCRSLNRRMNSSNGDSQSDVRFLTSDEVLDFTIDNRDYEGF